MNDFYTAHSDAYHQSTFHVDPTSFLTPLCRYLPNGARVLDIGCGSGRDILWMKKQGFKVTGFDRSFPLSAVAARKTGCPVIVGDFSCFDFCRFRMDALLLIGALVHVPPGEFQLCMKNILQALKPGGFVLISLKEGKGAHAAVDGRVFYHWSVSDLEDAFLGCGLEELEGFRQGSLLRNEDVWLTYVLKMKG